MRVSTIIMVVIFVIFGGLAWVAYWTSMRPEASDLEALPELDLSAEPLQTAATGDSIPILERGNKRVVFRALARYRISGLLVSKHNYRGKFMNRLSPCDYALVWGEVPNQMQYLKFNQVVRYCLFYIKDPSQVDVRYVANHMSNNHLIPANENIRRAIKRGKKGMKVELEGYLVRLKVYKGERVFSTWSSSLTRTDDGGGACELIYLTKLRIEDKVYE
ncbi:MAG: hypothetical protein CVU48_04820 [Candidatus Cloacimonetes bacterium HGW-Cloacimonetes-1]|jgi:hypothetical protein|nr:MAG: hypothetical protein CVU48_04820 [Candidatus Cloacimonetes bacterium HGW-Cloacimonetes-1]